MMHAENTFVERSDTTNEKAYALVTGASSGIGKELCKELADRGRSILAVSDQSEKLDHLQEEINTRFETTVITFCIDLSRPSSAEELYTWIKDQGINLDMLINNAGILYHQEFESLSKEQVEKLIHLHMTTTTLLCSYFVQQISGMNKSYILNVSSISAKMPYPTISLYGPSKDFIRQFTRALRFELRPKGVNVCCLIPGATDTSLYDLSDPDRKKAKLLGVMTCPGSVAKKAIYALFKNKAECVPGLMNRFILMITTIVPYSLISFIYRLRK